MTEGKLEIGTRVAYEGDFKRRPYPIPVGTEGRVTLISDRGCYCIYQVTWDVLVPGKHLLQRYFRNELRVLNGELEP